MTQYSREQLNQVVSRALQEVGSEAQSQERAFRVADLRAQLTDLAQVGGEVAWTISYSTAAAGIEGLTDVARIGSEVAWTISYSTAAQAIEKASPIEKKSTRG